MDTRKLLEELENVINNASEVPLTNKKLVDKDEIERLIDAINQSLPNELESARRIVADKERIMLDAEKKAEDTVAQAKDYIARITEESELVKQAQERANEVISSANKSADELRTSSVTYATDVLKYVETNMENVLDRIAAETDLRQPEKEPSEPDRFQFRRCPSAGKREQVMRGRSLGISTCCTQ